MSSARNTTKFVIASTLLYTLALAQTEQPVSPADYVKQESPANANGLTYRGGQLAPPPNLLELLQQCNGPTALLYDSNHSGKVDALKVYGVSRIDPQLWALRGPISLGPALDKAEIRAKAYAVEFLNGVSAFQEKLLTSSDTTTSVAVAAGTAGPGGTTSTSTALLSEVRESLVSISGTRSEGFIRFGRVTGTRLVSLGSYGMCVVVRYELPLDQSHTPGQPASGQPASPQAPASPAPPPPAGYPPLEPGTSGPF